VITSTNTGGAIDAWSISPTLPAGLAFNTSTGAITGTPTAASTNTTYTITATNATGNDMCTFDIEVTFTAPTSTIGADPSSSLLTLRRGATIPADATFLRFNTDGSYRFESQDGDFLFMDSFGNFVSPAGDAADWDVLFDPNFTSDPATGVTIDGPAGNNTWINVSGADVVWGFGQDNTSSNVVTVDVHFRPNGSGLNVGDAGTTTWTVTITGRNML